LFAFGFNKTPHKITFVALDCTCCWLRDTYYTLHAFQSLGRFEEIEAYSRFIENLNIEALSSLQPAYSIDGSHDLTEKILELEGYRGHIPVRIGNEAARQVQNDAYGQVLLTLHSLFTDERVIDRNRVSISSISRLLSYIERTIEMPDSGVWEFRNTQAIHTYSLLFHWAGSSACKKIAEVIGHDDLRKRAIACIQRAQQLIEKAHRPDRGVYAQSQMSNDVDASLLQMITLGYFNSSRKKEAIQHLRAIQQELEFRPGFFLRYRHNDDFGQQQSSFLVCSFWFIEAHCVLGFADEARERLENVLKAQNHLGLLSEDYDVDTQSPWGNFPQTYSHVGLINCAFAIDRLCTKPSFL
jgi:GH15 family glucan-1,4-alpha-glucosidase